MENGEFTASPSVMAILPLSGDEDGAVTGTLHRLAAAESWQVLDQDLTNAALQGAAYRGSLNLHRDEARALGQSLGCEFFILGRTLTTRRQVEGNQFYFESLTGIFFVETHSGRLVHFQFLSEKAKAEAAARQQLLAALALVWPACQRALAAARQSHQTAIESAGRATAPLPEVIHDNELKAGDKLPLFYQRLKPDYTTQAEALGISATVELEAVFQANGTVDEIEVVRWAGFGLDEAAVATVKKMRFRPAQQHEKDVSLRGLVRYNFRRPIAAAERTEEAERLKRSLRTLPRP